jgi:hypothetical protein
VTTVTGGIKCRKNTRIDDAAKLSSVAKSARCRPLEPDDFCHGDHGDKVVSGAGTDDAARLSTVAKSGRSKPKTASAVI